MSDYIKRDEILAQIESMERSIEAAVNCNYRAALSDVRKMILNIHAAKTNYARIKSMSIEETADYIYIHDDMLNDKICKTIHKECPFGDNVEPENCKACIKQWLESEVTE